MHTPRNDLELYNFIQDRLGYSIPTVGPTPGTDAPFTVLSDLFFGKVGKAVIMAARGSGKTMLLAILNLLVSLFRPGTVSLSAAAVLAQTDVGHTYLRRFCRLPDIRDHVVENFEDRIRFKNGSEVLISSGGADSSVVGKHAHRLQLDEADTWDMPRYQNILLSVTGDVDHVSQIIVASTRYSDSGLLAGLLEDETFKAYKFDFFTSLAQCGACSGPGCRFYTTTGKDGLLKPFCQGRGLMARGFIPLGDVVTVAEATSGRTWAVQQQLQDPAGASGLLWPTFSRGKHVRQPPDISSTAARVVGVDWGLSPAIVMLARAEDGTWWSVEELGGEGVSLAMMTDYAVRLATTYSNISFFCGAHDQLTAPMIGQWGELGIVLIPMSGKMTQRQIRHEEVGHRLDDGSLLFTPDVSRTIMQVSRATLRSEQGKRSEDDFRDALSYACAGRFLTGGEGGTPGGGFMM